MGTPSYMSPEQFMGHKVDGRSDIFSAGVIFYQFITGENPFSGRSMQTIMYKILNENPANPSALNLQITPALNEVIKKAISKRADERFQTAEEFLEAIQRVVQNNEITGSSETPVDRSYNTKSAETQNHEEGHKENDLEKTFVLPPKISEKKSENKRDIDVSDREITEETADNGNPEKTFIINPLPTDHEYPEKKNKIKFVLVGAIILLVLLFSEWRIFFSKPEKEPLPPVSTTSKPEKTPSEKKDTAVTVKDQPSATPKAPSVSEVSVEVKTDPQNAAAFLKKIKKDMSLAEILEQGESKGETPLKLSLQSGIYELTLKKDGYYDFATELEIETGADNISFEAKLIKTE